MTDKTERAVNKLMGINTYAVAVRVTGYYNIIVNAEDKQKAEELARYHEYTWQDLSHQDVVEIDQVEVVDYD